jgi:hypothetical protein
MTSWWRESGQLYKGRATLPVVNGTFNISF